MRTGRITLAYDCLLLLLGFCFAFRYIFIFFLSFYKNCFEYKLDKLINYIPIDLVRQSQIVVLFFSEDAASLSCLLQGPAHSTLIFSVLFNARLSENNIYFF